MHLVGFIIRIYHDARSSERQKQFRRLGNDFTSRIFDFSHRGFVGRDGEIVTVAAIFPSILVFP